MKKVQLDVLKGNDLKVLLEQISKDGHVNTLPELFEFLDKVPEDTDLEEYIRSIAGGGGQVPDNSVGTKQLIDGSVVIDKLSDEVREKMTVAYDDEGEGIILGGFTHPAGQDTPGGDGETGDGAAAEAVETEPAGDGADGKEE